MQRRSSARNRRAAQRRRGALKCPAFPDGSSVLALGLELRLVLFDERANVVCEIEELPPLLFVERDGEPPEAVDRDSALLRHLHRDRATAACFEPLVLGLEAFELGLEVFVCHWFNVSS